MIENYMRTIEDTIQKGPYKDNWESLSGYSIPEWYKDAKFGIFIHWGVYSVPAFGSEWYPRQMYLKDAVRRGKNMYDHHVSTYGPPDKFGYKDFIPMFKAEKFDPAQWAELFNESGAKFVMPVAEHHDGFQMYGSKLSRWNCVQMGPQRDVLGELRKEITDRGMVFSVSSHRAENWWFYSGGRSIPSDVQDERYRDLYGPAQEAPLPLNDITMSQPNKVFLDDWLARTCELVDQYEPQIVWFDWWIQNIAFKPYLQKFAAYYYNRAAQWGKEVAINYKWDAFMMGTAVFDVERGQLRDIRPELWQTDTAVAKNSWGYTENNDYKTAESLVCDLVDIVSKNGCLLLNIGPKADGTIPEEDASILRKIGKWLAVHQEAIYETRFWKVYGEGSTEVIEGMHTELKRKPFGTDDIRFTFRHGILYAFVLKWPEDGQISIKSLGRESRVYKGQVQELSLLSGNADLNWKQTDDALRIDASRAGKFDMPACFRISLS